MPQAPHLPPREEQPQRKLKEFLLFVLFTVFLAFSAGIAAAAVAFAWLIPAEPASRSIFTFFQNSQAQSPVAILTSDESKNAQQRIVKIFDKRKKIPGNFYDDSALFGNATLLTLDGWAVLYAPTLATIDKSFLETVDSQGRIRTVEKIVFEPSTGLVYLDIQGDGFPVFPLFTGEIPSDSIVWSLKENHFVETELLFSFPKQKESARAVTSLFFHLSPQSTASGLLINEKGELIGFADKNGVVVLAEEINRELRFLQKNGTIDFAGLPLTGYVVEGVETDERGIAQIRYGFFVTESVVRGKNAILIGDVVLRIGEKYFDPRSVREEIFSAPEEITLTVLRQGKTLEVKVKKS